MGKMSKKIFVYLDQNFISNIAKLETEARVDPQYSEIFDLLHQGCRSEKTFVAKSIFHDFEISLATHLKERFFNRLYQLGQVQLEHYDTIQQAQIFEAARLFVGESKAQGSKIHVFHENPDHRIKMFDIHVDMRFEELFDYRTMRRETGQLLSDVRDTTLAARRNYDEQYEAEMEAARQNVIKNGPGGVGYIIRDRDLLEKFVYSKFFSDIPSIHISSSMWAAILTDRFGPSPVRTGHSDDIQIISTYLPYADIFTTDSFMARLLERLDIPSKYETRVFGAGESDLGNLKMHLQSALPSMPTVNVPVVSIFVLSDTVIKNNSFEFFKGLGNQAMSAEHGEGWVEIFAFDDGEMPRYHDKRMGVEVPFTGIQEIEHIKIDSAQAKEAVETSCRNHCRSTHFVLINHHRHLPENFLTTLIQYVAEDRDRILSYRIIKKH